MTEPEAAAFLGGAAAPPQQRRAVYGRIREQLGTAARAHWDARADAVERGVLHSGASERLIAAVAAVIRAVAEPRSRIERLASCESVEEQRRLYEREWNNRRWRAVFLLLANRLVLRRTYDPAFFTHVDSPSFARHFLRTVEIALTELPVKDNYFFHDMLFGHYITRFGEALPPYLQPANAAALADVADRLTLVDGGYLDFLRTRPDGELAGFSLSNIFEWLTPEQIDELIAEIVRTARPGAKLVFRNFLGWNEVPQRWRDVVVEDVGLGSEMIRRDRSMMQRRIAVCTVGGAGAG